MDCVARPSGCDHARDKAVKLAAVFDEPHLLEAAFDLSPFAAAREIEVLCVGEDVLMKKQRQADRRAGGSDDKFGEFLQSVEIAGTPVHDEALEMAAELVPDDRDAVDVFHFADGGDHLPDGFERPETERRRKSGRK